MSKSLITIYLIPNKPFAGLRGAASLVVAKAVPKPDQDFLKQVVDFGLVVREHVAHRVDSPFVLPHQKFKLMFFVVVHNAFFVATFIMLDNKGRELLQASRFFCTFAAQNHGLETRDGPSTSSGTFVPQSRSPAVKKDKHLN